MKLIIDKNRKVYSAGTWGTVNENDYEILEFEFPAELDGYNKRIVYYLGDERVWDTIVNNKAYITNAITTKGDVKAYVWCTKENTEREADTDFRTMLFDMHFYENENADGIVPTEQQVDGFNTMLTAMNEKIDEVDALEQTIETAEAQRQEAEATRVSNENTRESNESTRQTNEQTRQTQEAERERRTDEAIGNIEDKTAEYNANAEAKTTAFNNNATQKTNDFNSNYTQKANDFNTNASSKELAFNSNASSKTSAFNSNAEAKTNTFNTNATNKTNDFNTNAENKTSAFNTNAESKTSAFNDNATQKTTNFDNNASEKTDEFNTNAQEKIDEYDEHIADYQAQIDELQEEVEELSENMPWNTTEQATKISVDDAAKYSKNKLELYGNTSQDSTTGINLLNLANYRNYSGNGIGITINSDKSFKINGTVTSGFGYNKNIPNGLALDGDYTFVLKCTKNISQNTLTFTLGTGSAIPGTNIQNLKANGINIVNFTLENVTATQVRCYFNKNNSFDNSEFQLYLLKGTYTEKNLPDYEIFTNGASPNPDYPQPIHVVTGNNTISVNSKNLFNKDNVTLGKRIGPDGAPYNDSTYCLSDYIEVNELISYTYSGGRIGGSSAVAFYDNNKNFISRTMWSLGPTEGIKTFTPTQNTKYIRLTDFSSYRDTMQIEQSSTASSYVPYYHADYPINLGSIELCKIGNYQDYIYKENGNWYKYNAINKVVLDGTESWNMPNSSSYPHLFQVNDVDLDFVSQDNNAISNYFIWRTSLAEIDGFKLFVSSNRKYLRINHLEITSTADFKTWLSTHNTSIYYQVNAPTTAQITDTTLIAQLEAIYNKIALVKGTNHITITPSDLEPYVTLNYMQDLPSKLDNLDSRLALLE